MRSHKDPGGGFSNQHLETISSSCYLSKRGWTLPVGRHSTARSRLVLRWSVSSDSKEQWFSHKVLWEKGLSPHTWRLFGVLSVSNSMG